MNRRIGRCTLAFASVALAGQPAAAATITFSGFVPTVCELNYQFDGTQSVTTANLAVFCNAAEGSHLSAVLMGGDPNGYTIMNAGRTIIAKPGREFDIRDYPTAYWGRENIEIRPIAEDTVESPTIIFQIIPEG